MKIDFPVDERQWSTLKSWYLFTRERSSGILRVMPGGAAVYAHACGLGDSGTHLRAAWVYRGRCRRPPLKCNAEGTRAGLPGLVLLLFSAVSDVCAWSCSCPHPTCPSPMGIITLSSGLFRTRSSASLTPLGPVSALASRKPPATGATLHACALGPRCSLLSSRLQGARTFLSS